VPLLACPYCYDSFRERAIEFRCTGRAGPNGTCPRSRDPVLVERIGLSTPVPPAFPGDGRKLTATCPTCRGPTNYRICPRCHSQLPVHFGKVDSRLIAMIGAKESGKTVYMTVLIHELMHRVGQQFDAAVVGSDDNTRRQFTADYEEKLYRRRELFDTTQSAAATRNRRAPLVFRFTTERTGLRGRRPAHSILSFFDTAGEDLVSEQSVHLNVRYLTSADGIILLLDPLQMRGARRLALPGTEPAEGGSGAGAAAGAGPGHDPPVNVLSRVTELLRGQLKRPSDRIQTPIAVAFSKIDTLRHSFPEGSALRRQPSPAPAFDTADSVAVHEHVQALLHRWEGGQLDQILRHGYTRYRYFALSALGESPTSDRRVSELGIQPYRVQDPFLWLLSELGTIPATKD
jgi:GTPase SAR1 family protein